MNDDNIPTDDTIPTSNDGTETLVQHDLFMDKLMRRLQATDENGAYQDPFVCVEKSVDRYPVYDEGTHWRLRHPKVGEKYLTVAKFKEGPTFYALANGFSIWYERCNNKKVVAKCGYRPPRITDPDKGKQRKQKRYPTVSTSELPSCPWRCYGRRMRKEKTFQIQTLVDEHKCVRNSEFGSLVNYKWIGYVFGEKIRGNPDIRLTVIADLVMRKYKCKVSLNQCRNAERYALTAYEKSVDEHYALLRSYGRAILDTNPGSTVKLGVTVNPDGKTYFDRFYVCFAGLADGWRAGCRKVIALDGCFLKRPNQGEILIAIERDGNNHIYPVAWAVVNVENKDNWSWFLELLEGDLGCTKGQGLTLMSDQHKGLIEAVKDVMPYAEHRQCARHIYEGFRKQFTGFEFRDLFWAASKASYPPLFYKTMDKIKIANPKAHKYLMDKNPKTWSRAFFEVNRGCEAVENGFSECFNSVILSVRDKPLITMLEAIRVIVLERMHRMREISKKWNPGVCPSIQRRLEWLKDQQRFWHVIPAGGNVFKVRSGSDAFTVDEPKMSCTCRMWQLSGIPCVHATKVILYLNKLPEAYVPSWFETDMYFVAYHHYLKPVGGMNFWPDQSMYSLVLPPKPKKMPGRPRKKRIRAKGEGGSSSKVSRVGIEITCSICNQIGHNKKTCKENSKGCSSVEKAPRKNVGGRPRKNKVNQDEASVADDVMQVRQRKENETSGSNRKNKKRACTSTYARWFGEQQNEEQTEIDLTPAQFDLMQTQETQTQDQGQEKQQQQVDPVVQVRVRRPSEGIIKRKLAKQLDGQGSTPQSAMNIDDA